jgi:putative NADH-flavin reductase
MADRAWIPSVGKQGSGGKEAMTVLVVGASGATGRQLVSQLLERGLSVKIIVRNPQAASGMFQKSDRLSIIEGSILEISDIRLAEYTRSCDAIASCLGHTMTLKGIFGKPRFLVTDATKKICSAIKVNNPERKVKYVLMNTAGNMNKNLGEKRTLAEKCFLFLTRNLVPPQKDNEQAAEYLRTVIGSNDKYIEWTAVRPDSLINNPDVSEYEVVSSPTRSPLFNPGKTSRINVGHFMAELITNDAMWNTWKGTMPVIYNAESFPGLPTVSG